MGPAASAGRRAVHRLFVAICLPVIVVACGAGASPVPAGGGSASPSTGTLPVASSSPSAVAVTPSPTLAPASPSVAPSAIAGTLCAKTINTCSLPPGTYTTAPFEHPFLVTFTTATHNDRAWPHGGEIEVEQGAYLQWGSGFVGATDPTGNSLPGPKTSAALLAFLEKIKGFTHSQASPVTIDGRTGTQVDILTNRTAVRSILRIPEDSYNLGAGEKVRFLLFDVQGAVVMLVEDIPDAKAFDGKIAALKPVIDSIRWL